ncbi:hypothetical protein OURE66S_03639 [Oligella ureolytica]
MEHPEHRRLNVFNHSAVVESSSYLQFFRRIVVSLLLLFSCMFFSSIAQADSRLAVFLPKVQAADIFPGADGYGPVEGNELPIARVFKGQEAVGFVYLTTDIVNTRGYSSKPIDTLVALDNNGEIVGAKLVEHHEPIVLIGIPESRMVDFIQGYVGMNFIKNPLPIGSPPPVDVIVSVRDVNGDRDSILRSSRILVTYQIGMSQTPMISGATVTLMVIGDSILPLITHLGSSLSNWYVARGCCISCEQCRS